MKKGIYVAIDGPEATGKSTTIELLCSTLREKGFVVCQTKEPGSSGSEVCKSIRAIALNPSEPLSSEAEFFLFLADRAQHLQTVVLPALKRGEVVVADRSGITGLVYCLAGGMQLEKIKSSWQLAQTVWPDYAFISRADPGWSAQQLSARSHKDHIELRSSAFHRAVVDTYDKVVQDPQGLLGKSIPVLPLPATDQHSTKEIVEWILGQI